MALVTEKILNTESRRSGRVRRLVRVTDGLVKPELAGTRDGNHGAEVAPRGNVFGNHAAAGAPDAPGRTPRPLMRSGPALMSSIT